MSTWIEPFDDYGIVLDEKDADMILSVLKKNRLDNKLGNADDNLYAVYESGICEYVSDFTGDIISIRDDGFDTNISERMEDACVFYVPISKFPSLFSSAYLDIECLVSEFKMKLGGYYPLGYDFRTRLRHIRGVYVG